MTAADSGRLSNVPFTETGLTGDDAARRVGLTCRTAVDGRRAARALNDWARRFALGEPEFQVLWRLGTCSQAGLDQTSLAKSLACSPAQVSAVVERLQARGWIQQRQEIQDRRRHLWRLSPTGQSLVAQMLNAAGYLEYPTQVPEERAQASDEQREAA